ncbi:MAG: DUF1461 domain-containing protein, partial [Chloroflexi bacterium]|nr:DUF1461 domain-containing protein [Chloroflexota bacterium]
QSIQHRQRAIHFRRHRVESEEGKDTLKFLSSIARALFIASLPLLFFSAGIGWAVNSVWLYTSGFEKYGVSAATGLAEEELDKIALGLIRYWNSGEEFISLIVIKDGQPFQLFNERETAHLKDVKALFRLDYAVFSVTLAYALGYSAFTLFRRQGNRVMLERGVIAGSALTLGLMMVMGLSALLGEEQFARFWLQFHLFSFANNLWQLDPARDYLIMLVPQGFWYDAVRFIVFATASMAAAFGVIAAVFLAGQEKQI